MTKKTAKKQTAKARKRLPVWLLKARRYVLYSSAFVLMALGVVLGSLSIQPVEIKTLSNFLVKTISSEDRHASVESITLFFDGNLTVTANNLSIKNNAEQSVLDAEKLRITLSKRSLLLFKVFPKHVELHNGYFRSALNAGAVEVAGFKQDMPTVQKKIYKFQISSVF